MLKIWLILGFAYSSLVSFCSMNFAVRWFYESDDSQGSHLCAFDEPSDSLASESTTKCALICHQSPFCFSFNYDVVSSRCDIFVEKPTCFGPSSSCIYYQMQPDPPYTGIPAQNCSLPYTYGGQLYNGCASNLTGDGCNACLTQNRTITLCTRLLLANYLVSYVAVNITVPTLSGYTTVLSINGWIVVQQRVDGSLSFDKKWADYKAGFGSPSQNFWLGLEKLYQLTRSRRYRLRIEIQALQNNRWFSAEYDSFAVSSEATGYALNVTGYVGDAGDALNNMNSSGVFFQNGMMFSTSDKDNDGATTGACAASYPCGFWLNACYYGCLNCRYGTTEFSWYNLLDLELASSIQLKTSRMMIRPV